jgi:hypothetical protein
MNDDEMKTQPVPVVPPRPTALPPDDGEEDTADDLQTAPINNLVADLLSEPLPSVVLEDAPPDDTQDDLRTLPPGQMPADLLSKPVIVPPDAADDLRTLPPGQMPADLLSKPVIAPPDDADDLRTLPPGQLPADLLSKPVIAPPTEASQADDLRTVIAPPPAERRTAVNVAPMTHEVAPTPTVPNWMHTARVRLNEQVAILNPTRRGRWHEVVYTQDIDKLLAETALEDEDAGVAEQAARTIGRIRSQAAVAFIAERERKGERSALQALAVVRDEACSLPPIVSRRAKLYAWFANTWRRLTQHPTRSMWRFVFGAVGAALAFGIYTWVNLPGFSIFTPERWSKSISYGLTMGILMGFRALLAAESPLRMRGFFPWWGIVGASLILGTAIGALAWGAFTWLFLNYEIDWGLMLTAGLGASVGLAISALFRLPGWLATIVDAVSMWIPLYTAYVAFNETGSAALIYFREFNDVYNQLVPMCLLMAVGANAQALGRDIGWVVRGVRSLFRLVTRRPNARAARPKTA